MQPFILACVCFELNIPLIGGSGPVYDTVIDTKIDSIVEHLPYLVLHILDYKYMKYSLSEMKLFVSFTTINDSSNKKCVLSSFFTGSNSIVDN